MGDPVPWGVSVVIPTYREAANLEELISRLAEVRASNEANLSEVILVDDRSDDGSSERARSSTGFDADWVKWIERDGKRGLGRSMLDGIRTAKGPIILFMHADLSHPPEAIAELVAPLRNDRQLEMVIGTPGQRPRIPFGPRRIGRLVAPWLARPLTKFREPLSDFFAFDDGLLDAPTELRPIGSALCLEILVRCQPTRIATVPYRRSPRQLGTSQVGIRQRLRYLQHLRRLYSVRFGGWSHLIQFGVVGASGVIVNLAVLTLLLQFGVGESWAVVGAIAVSMVSNFVLNSRFTFDYARGGSLLRQFAGFVLASMFGAVINVFVTLQLRVWWPSLPIQVAAVLGVIAGMGFNFVASRTLVFRKQTT